MNPTKHYAELKIGKKTYKLTYDFDAIAKAEQLTGMRLMFAVEWRSVNVYQMRGMLLAALLPCHPEMTAETVQKMITPKTAERISTAIVEAWFENAEEPESGDDDEESNANPPTPEA